jgi:hypothetical protein
MPWVKSNLVCIVLTVAMQTQTARAQGDLLDTDGLAEAIVSMTSRVWTGPRTPAPDAVPRPEEASLLVQSPRALLTVHADPSVSEQTMQQAVQALEYVRARLEVMGWPAPISDGSLGGGPELDLYLTASLPPDAYSDGIAPWTYLDRASTFAVVSPATPTASLSACVTASYAEALLLSMDPAEARGWRRATAAWLTWELTGRFGCEEAITLQQAEPFRSWVRGGAGDGAGGALLLAYLSARHDTGRSQFIRDVWTLASQRTWEGRGLRADPDLWSAIETAVGRSGDRLLDDIEDLAVQRWFVGRADPILLSAIDSDARVPISLTMRRFPTRMVATRPLESFGSAYAFMDAAVWNGRTRLRAWLRGEYGVRWSFVVVQLDARGNEIRRLAAPHTGPTPNAYLPVELGEETRHLLIVVTNLSNAVPDADEPDVNERAFELTVSRADD